jgi:hypothetical protein
MNTIEHISTPIIYKHRQLKHVFFIWKNVAHSMVCLHDLCTLRTHVSTCEAVGRNQNGYTKLNLDASFHADTFTGAMGAVIRNGTGGFHC